MCRSLLSRLHTFLNNGIPLEKHSARLKPAGAADNQVKLNNIDPVLQGKRVHRGDNSFDHANASQVRSFNLRRDQILSLSLFYLVWQTSLLEFTSRHRIDFVALEYRWIPVLSSRDHARPLR